MGGATAYLLAVQRVDPFDHPAFKLDGLRDVGEHLLERVRRLLVEQDAHGLARFDAAAHHRHQLGSNKVFALLPGLAGGAGRQRLNVLLAGRGFHIHRPVGVDVLRVVDLLEGVL